VCNEFIRKALFVQSPSWLFLAIAPSPPESRQVNSFRCCHCTTIQLFGSKVFERRFGLCKTSDPKESKLAEISEGSFLTSSLRNALAEPRFRYNRHDNGAHMSIQKEFALCNPPSHRPVVAGSMHSSAMRCANPQCSKELLYLREGTLELLELESPSDSQFRPDEGAFAMNSLPSKFFWLCGECAKTHIVKRWTTSGLVLGLRDQGTAGGHPNVSARPATAAMHKVITLRSSGM
jgi:hypothetical protein